MPLFKIDRFNVTQQARFWWSLSAVAIVSSLIAMFISWQQFHSLIRPGLDFVGGTRLQLELDCTQPNNCDRPIDLAQVRRVLADTGISNSSAQLVGQQRALSIRTPALIPQQRVSLQANLARQIGQFAPEKTQIDIVGPVVGEELFRSGLTALLVAVAGIMLYLSLRFRSDYAVMAIVALLHDLTIVMGVFSILGLVVGTEADSLFLVAMLTIAGFSVQDTVVIFDRLRENLHLTPDRPFDRLIDDSVRQTLSRSIVTLTTVLFPLITLLIFGGETLKNFALALIIGFCLGAYSSIFIASPLLAWWRNRTSVNLHTQDS
jgi:preprotein translocase subunit SecF